MEFTELQHLTHEIGTAILALLYLLRLAALFRRRPARDIASNAKGAIWRGAVDAFVTIVAPWKMESTRRHWARYLEFVVFHMGILFNIVLSFAFTYAPGALTAPVRIVILVLLAAAFVAGGLRLCRRARLAEMRAISSPDDYVALVMVLLFFFTGKERSASEILLEQDEKSRGDDPDMTENLHKIKDIARQTRRYLEEGKVDRFGELLHAHWERLDQRIGVHVQAVVLGDFADAPGGRRPIQEDAIQRFHAQHDILGHR